MTDTNNERDVLEKCSTATIVTIAAAGHFTLNEKPRQIADILLDAVTS